MSSVLGYDKLTNVLGDAYHQASGGKGKERQRVVIAYVGEGGVKPDTAYRLRDGKLVEA